MNTQPTPATVKVWDPVVRIFHWSLVATFAIAWLTGDAESRLHVLAGYAVIGLVLARIVWGFIGTKHARFSDFIHRPATILGYGRDMLFGRARRYLGHNPLGGAMIVALLAALLATGLTGLALQETKEGGGPITAVAAHVASASPAASAIADDGEDEDDNGHEGGEGVWEEAHEFLASLTLLLVALHIGGVIVSSLTHRENLVRAMFTGRKPA